MMLCVGNNGAIERMGMLAGTEPWHLIGQIPCSVFSESQLHFVPLSVNWSLEMTLNSSKFVVFTDAKLGAPEDLQLQIVGMQLNMATVVTPGLAIQRPAFRKSIISYGFEGE